ncbi:MAG: glycosyltransferase [candidate division Zixibacteria bacterium]
MLTKTGLCEADFVTHLGLIFGIGLVITSLTSKWNALGQVSFTTVFMSAIAFLIYATQVTFFSHLGPWSLTFSIILLMLEIMALLLFIAHSFEVIDVICRIKWKREFAPKPTTDYFPKVSLHVPAYNEPPDMVIQTLDALAKLDYPNYEVLVIDNNTTDEKLWKPLKEHSEKLGFTFIHLENWPGFKSGALNYGLTKTDADAEIVGIIDADYVVEPDYLKDLVGYFADSETAFVQTPQDYRDIDRNDKFALSCYYSYRYFFAISMATRNERNGIIFGGTMGLIRRKVLEELGGWDEWCITEDAEISLRMLNMGYNSIYVDQSYGKGLMPLNYEGLKKQRFRWAFGGMQILRMHWHKLMPWSRFSDPSNKLSLGQKFDYLSGGLQWLNDPLAFGFTSILLICGITLAWKHTIYLQPLTGAALVVPFIFILFGVIKFLWAFRIRSKCTFVEAGRAFMILLSLTWAVTLACVLGLTKKEGVFLRTPKQRGSNTFARSLKVIGKEILLASLCILVIALLLALEESTASVLLMAGLLSWQAFIYGSAVIATRWSWHSEMMVTNPDRRLTSRSTGLRFRQMATDGRAVSIVLGTVTAAGILFYLSVIRAPELEKIHRTNPYKETVIAQTLLRSPPEDFVNAQIYLEEQAAINADVEQALALWSEDGIIRDQNYTPYDDRDDNIWIGLDQIRQRYEKEFSVRKYIKLDHQNVSTFIEENMASVVNDLNATIMSDGKIQQVFLSKGDQWLLRKEAGEWKIASLTLNRSVR